QSAISLSILFPGRSSILVGLNSYLLPSNHLLLVFLSLLNTECNISLHPLPWPLQHSSRPE
ncbi:MAG TPA: hypothetical protein VGL94_15000, partial [Ktedonobacteraceae bacterium]